MDLSFSGIKKHDIVPSVKKIDFNISTINYAFWINDDLNYQNVCTIFNPYCSY